MVCSPARQRAPLHQLLKAVASLPSERNQLLRSYFEPTVEEAEQGIKVPTAGHHAIAELVERGYVRVILTTNFDRLLERAIEQKGITPVVICNAADAAGALPIVHNRVTLIN
jgi:hypothetical protein